MPDHRAADGPVGDRASGPVRLPGWAGLGTAPLGSGPGWELDWGPASEQESVSAVRAAVAAGVGWVDTAPFYGWGRAERAVGLALGGLAQQGTTADGTPADGITADGITADGITADGITADGVAAAPDGAVGRPVLLTKCGTLRGQDGRSYEDHRAATIRADLEASLTRLGCPAVDVPQLA